MNSTTVLRDAIDDFDAVYLERLRLAADVILELEEDAVINDVLVSELGLFRERVQRALLLPPSRTSPQHSDADQ